MYFGKIDTMDIANGDGIRVTLFVSGCRNHCEGCFQPKTWNFKYGQPFTEEIENYIINSLNHDFVSGLTLLGGDPFEPENAEVLAKFVKKVKQIYPNKSIWCYTGYKFEELHISSVPSFRKLIEQIDVLVDGKFEQQLYQPGLKFRGSANQRIIDVPATLTNGEIILKYT